VALTLVVLAAVAWLWPVSGGGQTAFVTTHGISMEPRFHTGDLAVVHAASQYQVGDVVAYRSISLKTVVMHRIVARDGAAFVFKGDNNSFLDPEHPAQRQLIGKLAMRIPQGGVWLRRSTSPAVLAGVAFLLMVVGGASAAQTRRDRKRRRTMSRHAARAPRSAPKLAELSPHLRSLAAGAAVLGTLAVAVGALAWARPVSTTSTVTAASSQKLTFSYSATVPATAAYAGTTASSPDPIFRKLAHTVDVQFAYRGGPGTIAVTGELTSVSGWRASLPLVSSTTFSTPHYTGTVRLDLAALDARANAAAKATGIPAGELSLRVIPQIRPRQGAPFAPALTLTLTPLQLKLTGGPSSLVATDPTVMSTQRLAPRRLGMLGHTATVATLRRLTLGSLLVSLLLAALVGGIARRTSPGTEAARIRRRYNQILVPVHPMTTVAGRPVVDVTDFATLARLADRYGLLVLHWSRSGVETFVVQDEGTTFRYRAGDGGRTAERDSESRSATVDARPAGPG
jgi:signal peptidase I